MPPILISTSIASFDQRYSMICMLWFPAVALRRDRVSCSVCRCGQFKRQYDRNWWRNWNIGETFIAYEIRLKSEARNIPYEVNFQNKSHKGINIFLCTQIKTKLVERKKESVALSHRTWRRLIIVLTVYVKKLMRPSEDVNKTCWRKTPYFLLILSQTLILFFPSFFITLSLCVSVFLKPQVRHHSKVLLCDFPSITGHFVEGFNLARSFCSSRRQDLKRNAVNQHSQPAQFSQKHWSPHKHVTVMTGNTHWLALTHKLRKVKVVNPSDNDVVKTMVYAMSS